MNGRNKRLGHIDPVGWIGLLHLIANYCELGIFSIWRNLLFSLSVFDVEFQSLNKEFN